MPNLLPQHPKQSTKGMFCFCNEVSCRNIPSKAPKACSVFATRYPAACDAFIFIRWPSMYLSTQLVAFFVPKLLLLMYFLLFHLIAGVMTITGVSDSLQPVVFLWLPCSCSSTLSCEDSLLAHSNIPAGRLPAHMCACIWHACKQCVPI